MNPLLLPQPMTAEQIRDLVERARIGGVVARSARIRATTPMREDVRRAIGHSLNHRVTLAEAAREYGVPVNTLRAWWRTVHPDVPTRPHLRGQP